MRTFNEFLNESIVTYRFYKIRGIKSYDFNSYSKESLIDIQSDMIDMGFKPKELTKIDNYKWGFKVSVDFSHDAEIKTYLASKDIEFGDDPDYNDIDKLFEDIPMHDIHPGSLPDQLIVLKKLMLRIGMNRAVQWLNRRMRFSS